MKNIFQFLLLGFLLFACANDTDVTHEMSKFDKAFVPVWYFVQSNNAKQAENHAYYLEQKWYDLKDNYQDVIGAEIVWEDTYNCVDELLISAFHNIEYHDIENAKYDLEGVQFELMELRTRYGIDYLLDYVWEFQMTYDLIKTLTNEQYYYREWHEFDCLVEEMNYTWNDLLKAENNQFWNSSEQQTWRKCRTKISTLLFQYNGLLQQDTIDETLAIQRINDIEPVLLEMIQLFGDFEKGVEITAAKI